MTITDPAAAATTMVALAPIQRSDTQRPVGHPLLYQIYTPDKPAVPNLQYDYDALGRVKQVEDAEMLQVGDRGPYSFYIADGTRGERDDPLGDAWSVTYDTYGHPSRYIDERGYETDAISDGRGRVTQYTYPETDCEVFGYDDHNNTTSYKRVDETSSCNVNAGAAHVLSVSATWDQGWNKPTQITDANGSQTNFQYFGSNPGASLLETATRPADANGNHPIYSFTYDGAGKLLTSTDPVTATTSITTQNHYDSNENLTWTKVDPSGLALTTSFDYTGGVDGDVKTVTDPRNNATVFSYDNDRRPLYSIHHDGALTTSPINSESKIVYDVLGQDTEDDIVKCFDNASTCPASGSTPVTWVASKKTTYTPTSKVATVTDADNRVVSTMYDGADRPFVVTDAALRQTKFTYDPAGNVLTETRGLGTQDEAVYATYTYGAEGEKLSVTDADGSGHLTQYAYDGFNRPATTIYPDGTTEQITQYDANSNILIRINRAGQTFTYTYDALNRMLTKAMPAVAGISSAVTTSWVYYLNGSIADLSDTAGNDLNTNNGANTYYDTAGRLVRTDTTIPGITGALTTSYQLDANGNRTRLTWPDSYYVTYAFDSLNRMTTVKESGTTQIGNYSYDAVSRRTNLTYRAGMSSTYTYTDASDLLTLALATGSGTVPSYTLGYSNAHQLASETVSASTYVWQPPANATDAYTAVNNLNQYPSWTPSGGTLKTLGYDANGNLTSANLGSGNWTYSYDPENKLVKANKTSGGVVATYAYDPLGRRTQKSGTGVTQTYFVSDGTDEIAEYTGAGALSLRYVPGSTINQPIASVSSTGTRKFLQYDRHGSVIAVASNGGTETEGPYTYDAYGNGAPTTGVAYKYVGMRLDPETGLYFDRARYYSSILARFYQPVSDVGTQQ